jgi:Ribonuclease P/MRP, subunit p29
MGFRFQVGCVCPVASVMAWVYVRVAWIDDGGHAGAGTDCSCDEGYDAFSCWDACQARQGRFSWLDYDQFVVLFPCLRVCFSFVDADDTARRSKNASLVGVSGIVVQETENTFKVVTRKDKLKGARARLPPLFCMYSLFTVLPKQGSVFAFAVPLYSTESESSRSASAAALAATGSGTNSGTNGRDAADADVDADADAGAGGDYTRETRTVLDGPHIEFELYGNQFCFRAADRAGRKFKHKETIEL